MSPLSLEQRLAFERKRKATQAPSASSPAADAPPPAAAPEKTAPRPQVDDDPRALLRKAQAATHVRSPRAASEQIVVASLAWFRGEVAVGQLRVALDHRNVASTYGVIARGLLQAFRDGRLVLK